MIKKIFKTNTSTNLEKAFRLIKTPVLTEKTTLLISQRQYVFQVVKSASKPEIKRAVEAIFQVKVNSVNTLRRPGKEKRFKGRKGYTLDFKRAIVQLTEGSVIDMELGVSLCL